MSDQVKEKPFRKRSRKEWIDLVAYVFKAFKGRGHVRFACVLIRSAALLLVGPPILYVVLIYAFDVAKDILGTPYGQDAWGYFIPILSVIFFLSGMYVFLSGENKTYRKLGAGGVSVNIPEKGTFAFVAENLCDNRDLVAKFIGFSSGDKMTPLRQKSYNAENLRIALQHLGNFATSSNFPPYSVTKEDESTYILEVQNDYSKNS